MGRGCGEGLGRVVPLRPAVTQQTSVASVAVFIFFPAWEELGCKNPVNFKNGKFYEEFGSFVGKRVVFRNFVNLEAFPP